MSTALKSCGVCGELFCLDGRTRGFQKVCSKAGCRRERKRLADARWRADNPGYRDQDKVRKWAAGYPDYWQAWRAEHRDYVKRNREQTRQRMEAKRLLFAKQDAIRKDPVGYLEGLRSPGMFAKQDAMIPRVLEGILTYLTFREVFAKPNAMASPAAEVASSGP